MKKIVVLTLLFSLCLLLFGCDEESSESSDALAEGAQAQVEEQPTAEEVEGEEAAEEPAEEEYGQEEEAAASEEFTYRGLDLGGLTAQQRTELRGLTESELCPCPDAVVSLHECLQEEDVCEDAREMASTYLGALQEGAAAEEASGRVAQQRQATGRVHQFILEDSPYKGSLDAAVVIVEFADFQCPHCRTAAQTMDEVYAEFGDQIAVVFKNFPLGSPVSDEAARAAMAAHNQNRFWPMHDLIFRNQNRINRQQINGFANQLGMNFERFQQDMNSSAVRGRIARDQQEGMNAGVTGTPALFINGQRYAGPLTKDAISAEIRGRL